MKLGIAQVLEGRRVFEHLTPDENLVAASAVRGDRAAAILALVGAVNLPIIHFSVEWWNTLHQPSIIKTSGMTVDTQLLLPLFLMMGAFTPEARAFLANSQILCLQKPFSPKDLASALELAANPRDFSSRSNERLRSAGGL